MDVVFREETFAGSIGKAGVLVYPRRILWDGVCRIIGNVIGIMSCSLDLPDLDLPGLATHVNDDAFHALGLFAFTLYCRCRLLKVLARLDVMLKLAAM